MTSSAIVIRDIESFDEMREVETLQKDVWQFSDRDVIPRTILVPTKEVGGVLLIMEQAVCLFFTNLKRKYEK